MYTRLELNIRTTANFLLALAANHDECRKYLKYYFAKSIRLPSDWIEVAELYQTFYDGSINYGPFDVEAISLTVCVTCRVTACCSTQSHDQKVPRL